MDGEPEAFRLRRQKQLRELLETRQRRLGLVQVVLVSADRVRDDTILWDDFIHGLITEGESNESILALLMAAGRFDVKAASAILKRAAAL